MSERGLGIPRVNSWVATPSSGGLPSVVNSRLVIFAVLSQIQKLNQCKTPLSKALMAANGMLSLGDIKSTASCHILHFRGTLKPGSWEVRKGGAGPVPFGGTVPDVCLFSGVPAGAALEKNVGVLLGDHWSWLCSLGPGGIHRESGGAGPGNQAVFVPLCPSQGGTSALLCPAPFSARSSSTQCRVQFWAALDPILCSAMTLPELGGWARCPLWVLPA